MQSLAEDLHTIVAELEAEGHKLAARLKAVVAKLTGGSEPASATPAEPGVADSTDADAAAPVE